MDYGTDVNSNGKLDSRGQVPIISGVDNVRQAIKNRLLTYKGTYSYIDPEYGSNLKDYLGMAHNKPTRQLVCLEMETITLKDPQVAFAECNYNNKHYHLKWELIGGEKGELIL